MPVLQKKSRSLNPTRTIAISFILVILTGTLLLTLPISAKDGNFTPINHALFTSTSATCVTGLVIYDTFQHWTTFGQVIIILLIQVGGLGLVTFVTFFNFIIGKKLGLRRMQLASESVSADGFDDARILIKNVIKFTLSIEAIGAIILSTVFVPEYGARGIFKSVFIAISAFCNAGFDILCEKQPFMSVIGYNSNPVVLITIMALIVCGGLGFVVWNDLLYYRKTKHLFLHTKVVLMVTAFLIVSGTIAFLLVERDNPLTMANMSFGDKLMNSMFQSISCRTAGFDSLNNANLDPVSKVFSIILMYIGAAPGSTGGGIKITTFAVILMTVVSVLRNKEDTTILGRKVEKSTVYKALTITMLSLTAIFIATLSVFYSLKQNTAVTGLDTLFEVVSAFGTVGMSVGITAVTNLFSELVLTVMMFIGRVGPIGVILFLVIKGADKSKKQVYPEGKILVG